MLGELNNTEVEDVLKEQYLGRIACHADGITYIVPVSYAYDGRYVYIRSKNGMKIDIMRKSPAICFEVEAVRTMGDWKTVIAWGNFEEITDSAERKDALQKLYNRHLPAITSELAHLSSAWPFEPGDLNTVEGVVYRLDLKKKTGRFESQEGASNMANLYFNPDDEEI
jgi:nitroimidazol reductase NimA-like FMN-containing flavoprotein (pyridoxamine 5'-phosphate oxidase superfamily)